MTDTNKLLSENPKERNAALAELVGGRDAVLLIVDKGSTQLAHTTLTPTVLASLFTSLVWAAQELGRNLGLQLSWVSTPARDDEIVVPRGGGVNGLVR